MNRDDHEHALRLLRDLSGALERWDEEASTRNSPAELTLLPQTPPTSEECETYLRRSDLRPAERDEAKLFQSRAAVFEALARLKADSRAFTVLREHAVDVIELIDKPIETYFSDKRQTHRMWIARSDRPSRIGEPGPDYGALMAATEARTLVELNAIMFRVGWSKPRRIAQEGQSYVLECLEREPDNPERVHPWYGVERAIETIEDAIAAFESTMSQPSECEAADSVGINGAAGALLDTTTRGDGVTTGGRTRRPNRTKGQIAEDEGKIARHLADNPEATRDETAEATQIAPAHVSNSIAWKAHRARRDEARKAERATKQGIGGVGDITTDLGYTPKTTTEDEPSQVRH